MSAPEANETSLVEEFDSTMKDVLEAWPKRWEEFKAEQAVLIEQMIGMATEEAKKGHCRCTFSGRFETLMHQGDTRAVLQSHGFDSTGSTIHWHHKTIGRAEELRKIYISSLSNVDIQNLRKNVMEHIESFSTEPFRFDSTGSTIHWHHKTIGRAEELRKISNPSAFRYFYL